MSKLKLIMMKGLPASGKSTEARKLVDSGVVQTRVNKDDLRAMLHNGKHTRGNENEVIRARDALIRASLASGRSVVVDDTNFVDKHEVALREIANEFGAEFSVMFIDTPVDVCIARDAKRANQVGASVIRRMYRNYIRPQFTVQHDLSLQTAILVDMDGTLADNSARSPFAWTESANDAVVWHVAETVRLWHRSPYGIKIIVVTGRDGEHIDVYKAWLDKHMIPFDAIFARAAGDNRRDSIVKQEIYENNIKGVYNVLFVLDDRQQVVQMWRDNGLVVYQVAEGDF